MDEMDLLDDYYSYNPEEIELEEDFIPQEDESHDHDPDPDSDWYDYYNAEGND